MRLDRFGDGLHVPIDDVERVEGHASGGEFRRVAQIDEQRGRQDLSRLAGRAAGLLRKLRRGEKRSDGYVGDWPQLAGEPYVWRRLDPLQRVAFGGGGLGRLGEPGEDLHAAGRAAAAAAAGRGVRQAGPTAR